MITYLPNAARPSQPTIVGLRQLALQAELLAIQLEELSDLQHRDPLAIRARHLTAQLRLVATTWPDDLTLLRTWLNEGRSELRSLQVLAQLPAVEAAP